MEELKTGDRVRVRSKMGESYVGYLFGPGLLTVKYRARIDKETQIYIIIYCEIASIVKLE